MNNLKVWYLRVAFVQQHAVDALRVRPTWTLVCCLAVTAWDLGQVCGEDLHLSYWSVHLEESEKLNIPIMVFQ